MNAVLLNLCRAYCGPLHQSLTFKELEIMTAMDPDELAVVLGSKDVTPVFVDNHEAFIPSEEFLRKTLWEYLVPFEFNKDEPEEDPNIVKFSFFDLSPRLSGAERIG